MTTKTDWMVVAGFLLAAFGLALRVFIMMQSSDAHPANATPLSGRNLLKSYSASHPRSRLWRAMWASLGLGLVLLIAGLLLEFR